MDNSYTPLHYPDNWPDIQPEQISRLYCIPVLNLLLKWNIAFSKYSYAYREIYKQLEQRGSVPVEIWGNDLPRIYIAGILEKVAQQHIWCENVQFIPDDSFDIVYNLTIGDLCEVGALMELEDIFEQDIRSDEQFINSLYKANMYDAIDIFLARITYNPNKYEKYIEENKFHSKGVMDWFLNEAAVWVLLLVVVSIIFYCIFR